MCRLILRLENWLRSNFILHTIWKVRIFAEGGAYIFEMLLDVGCNMYLEYLGETCEFACICKQRMVGREGCRWFGSGVWRLAPSVFALGCPWIACHSFFISCRAVDTSAHKRLRSPYRYKCQVATVLCGVCPVVCKTRELRTGVGLFNRERPNRLTEQNSTEHSLPEF